ncbi:MAG: hypothetical protein N2323_03145 [candidate division WOR-3 bacterium]|nr:hypothetical protein [candidate division WOR-3 bacterium]MCX7836939.1 hypothetical protein [candidate division WOR-3 bacterium]MDW8114140.1 hypothetical protein [candidate division WOR-3 bacterium]
MFYILIFYLLNSYEISFLLGDKTPFGRLKRYFYPTPLFSLEISKEAKFLDIGLSFTYSRFNNQYSSLYFLKPKFFFEPSFLTIKNKRGTLFLGLSYLYLIREVYLENKKKERGKYFDYNFGFGYKEKLNKINFRIRIFLSFIPERLTYEKENNFYYFLNSQIGVGYGF